MDFMSVSAALGSLSSVWQSQQRLAVSAALGSLSSIGKSQQRWAVSALSALPGSLSSDDFVRGLWLKRDH